MNAEDLCKKMQEEKKADSDECYEEMSSQEYLDEYFGTPYFSLKKYFRICDEERRKFNRYY